MNPLSVPKVASKPGFPRLSSPNKAVMMRRHSKSIQKAVAVGKIPAARGLKIVRSVS